MSTKISMAMAQENCSPECELFVAHCTLEFDDESSPLQDNEALQRVVHSAIVAYCQSVQE